MSFFYFKCRQALPVILFLAMLFASCTLFDANSDEETVSISLPDWPPHSQSEVSEDYPPLSCWKITLAKNDGTEVFHLSPNTTLQITVQKNCPFSLQAQPVTLLQNEDECLYFYPAGFIYPSEAETKATWEQGFSAFIMEGLYKNCKKNGFSDSQAARYVSSFNWDKMNTIIDEKIQDSIITQSRFYNPWLCDSAKILENLSNETFRTSLLTPSSCYQLSTEEVFNKTGFSILSSFIPENPIIRKSGQITIKKGSPMLVSDAKEFGLFISYLSAKNVQIEYIYMPIYKEEI